MSETFIRHNWSFEEAFALYHQPFLELIWQAQQIHRTFFHPHSIQVCRLQNIKVGGCPEDCAWCGQSIYNKTGVKSEPIATLDAVIEGASEAKAMGATRYCLAASWRGPTDRNLAKVLEMVKAIKSLGLESCITLGKLRPSQVQSLKDAGLDYYNHNLESSEAHFEKVSTTRDYASRLETLKLVREAGIKMCSGGILGMGETEKDRLELLLTLANQPEHPQSVPINQLVPIAGTPLENAPKVEDFAYIRCVALARILMPKAYIRLSGGRVNMSNLMQAMCFIAGANSIHYGGKKLLVTPNVAVDKDQELFNLLGIKFIPEAENSSKSKMIPLKVLHT